MKIIVDADACPVKSEIVALAKQHNIPVVMVSNLSHVIDDDYSQVITVDQVAESVDIAIFNMITSNDIVVTQDYGVATMVLGKGARAINQNGLVYSNENIDELLFARHIGAKQRRSGQKTKGPSKRKKTDNQRFSEEFEKMLR